MSDKDNSLAVKFDSIHLLLWLVKDTLWVMGFKYATLFMILPTVGYTFYLLSKNYQDKNYFILYLAILCWLLGNSAWILNDFLFENKYNVICYALFLLGIAIILFHILKQRNVSK